MCLERVIIEVDGGVKLNNMKEIVDAGADVNKADNKGLTALFIAAQKGHVEILRFLLEYKPLDYEKELIGSSFKIKNPQATSSCGCGTSFSL